MFEKSVWKYLSIFISKKERKKERKKEGKKERKELLPSHHFWEKILQIYVSVEKSVWKKCLKIFEYFFSKRKKERKKERKELSPSHQKSEFKSCKF